MKLIFRTIDTDKDKEIIIKFRKDSYVVSFGYEDGFGDENIYLQRMKERIRKFPDGQVIIKRTKNRLAKWNFKFVSMKEWKSAM